MTNNRGCDNCQPGWCQRHKVKKKAHWVKLCQTHDGYWNAWELQKGPGQRKPTGPPRFADKDWRKRIELWLSKRGVPESLFDEIATRFGLPPTGDCSASAWLRRVRQWVAARDGGK